MPNDLVYGLGLIVRPGLEVAYSVLLCSLDIPNLSFKWIINLISMNLYKIAWVSSVHTF